MEKNSFKKLFLLILPGFLLVACHKNYTRYFDDADDPGIAIFSNTGNNILSCLMDGKPWRTASRTTYGNGGGINYEVEIIKQSTNLLQDSLLIKWHGYFQGNISNEEYLILHLAIPPNFTFRDLSSLQGQRLSIDSMTNGFFSSSPYYSNTAGSKGNGSIYFHTASFDSVAPNTFNGKMSGLFEADFTSFKITRGRFDHLLSEQQVRF